MGAESQLTAHRNQEPLQDNSRLLAQQIATSLSSTLGSKKMQEDVVSSICWLAQEIPLKELLGFCSEAEEQRLYSCTDVSKPAALFEDLLFPVLKARDAQLYERLLDWRKARAV